MNFIVNLTLITQNVETTEHDELRRLLSDAVLATIAGAPMAMALLGASSLLLHHHPPTALQLPCASISATITTQGTSSSSSSSSRGSRQQRESLSRRNELKPKEELQARSSEQLLQFEREGHSCVRNLFDATEMASLEATVSAAAARERLNSYRHRVAVLCPGVDPFSLHSVSEAESVIRKKVPFFNHHKPRNAYVYNWFDYVKLHHWMCAYQAQGCTYNLLFLYVYSCENWKVEYMRCINLNKESAECWVSSEKILNPEGFAPGEFSGSVFVKDFFVDVRKSCKFGDSLFITNL